MPTPTKSNLSSEGDDSISPSQNQATRSAKKTQDSSAALLTFERVRFEPKNSSTRISVEKDMLTVMLGNEESRARMLASDSAASRRQC